MWLTTKAASLFKEETDMAEPDSMIEPGKAGPLNKGAPSGVIICRAGSSVHAGQAASYKEAPHHLKPKRSGLTFPGG